MDYKPPPNYVYLNTLSQCQVDDQLADYCEGDPQAQQVKTMIGNNLSHVFQRKTYFG